MLKLQWLDIQNQKGLKLRLGDRMPNKTTKVFMKIQDANYRF